MEVLVRAHCHHECYLHIYDERIRAYVDEFQGPHRISLQSRQHHTTMIYELYKFKK